jgi:hypothetical protein
MFKPSGDHQIDRLNQLALAVARGDDSHFWSLSTGERAYVALAANRADLLREDGNTIAEALARIGDPWAAALVSCWRFAGDPARKAGGD